MSTPILLMWRRILAALDNLRRRMVEWWATHIFGGRPSRPDSKKPDNETREMDNMKDQYKVLSARLDSLAPARAMVSDTPSTSHTIIASPVLSRTSSTGSDGFVCV